MFVKEKKEKHDGKSHNNKTTAVHIIYLTDSPVVWRF